MLVTLSGLGVLTVCIVNFNETRLHHSQARSTYCLLLTQEWREINLILAMTNRFYFVSNEFINRFYDCTFDVAWLFSIGVKILWNFKIHSDITPVNHILALTNPFFYLVMLSHCCSILSGTSHKRETPHRKPNQFISNARISCPTPRTGTGCSSTCPTTKATISRPAWWLGGRPICATTTAR